MGFHLLYSPEICNQRESSRVDSLDQLDCTATRKAVSQFTVSQYNSTDENDLKPKVMEEEEATCQTVSVSSALGRRRHEPPGILASSPADGLFLDHLQTTAAFSAIPYVDDKFKATAPRSRIVLH